MMKKYMIIGIILCLISNSVWSMKRVGSPNGRASQSKRVQVVHPFVHPSPAVTPQGVPQSTVLGQALLTRSKAVNLQSLKYLLAQGADVNVTDEQKKSALHYACSNGYYVLVKLLLDNNAQVAGKDSQGWTPLHLAAAVGHKEVCELLLGRGAPVAALTPRGATPLLEAVENGHKEVCELLLGRNGSLPAHDSQGVMLLYEAAMKGHKEVCELLLDRGVPVNVQDARGWPLHIAALNGRKEVCELLLDRGAQVDVPEYGGLTPLHIAAQNGRKEVCEVLLDHNAAVNALSSKVFTPLFLAAQNGRKEVCKLLLDRGAQVDVPNSNGWTPLHIAAFNGQKEVCELLIDRNAPVDAQDSKGWKPLHNAAFNGQKEVCELLIDRNAPVDARLNRDFVFNNVPMGEFTALHLAVYFNKLEVVKVLIAAHAAKYARKQDDRTVLNIARQRGHSELVTYLKNTLEEELPAAGSLPQLAAVGQEEALPNLLPAIDPDREEKIYSFSELSLVEEGVSDNLLSAIEQANTERVIELLEAKAYTADEVRKAFTRAKELKKYDLVGFMLTEGLVQLEALDDRLSEKVPMS